MLKDNHGWLPHAAVFEVTSHETTGALSWDVHGDEGSDADADIDGFRPTGLMERVSRALEIAGAPLGRNELVRQVRGKAEYVRQAVDVLVREGYVEEQPGPNRARLVALVRLYREAEDE